MSFLDTEPVPIQRMDPSGPWSRFRVTDPRQRLATLRELCRGAVPLSVGVAGAPAFPVQLWSLDEAQQLLHFSIATHVPRQVMEGVLGQSGLWAAGYLHEAKVQFDLPALRPGFGGTQRMLHAHAPRQMVHLPRRRALRVRHSGEPQPVAVFGHPLAQDLVQRLVVADISMTGCALQREPGGLPLVPGTQITRVEVELDNQSIFFSDLQVQHVTMGARAGGHVRIGCAWRGLNSGAAETLQGWIVQGRRRRDLISLAFD